jgi:hypothetical protein
MPGGDRTGPMGMGPMTGRGAGFCAGFGAPGFVNRWFGFGRRLFGRGQGRGGGRGWRNVFFATGLTGWQRAAMASTGDPFGAAVEPPPMSPEQEFQLLKQQADAAAATLEQVRRRIDELAARKTAAPTTE